MKFPLRFILPSWVACFVASMPVVSTAAAPSQDEAQLTAMVRADWQAQEKRLGRDVQSAEAIQAALERTRRLLADLSAMERLGGFFHGGRAVGAICGARGESLDDAP